VVPPAPDDKDIMIDTALAHPSLDTAGPPEDSEHLLWQMLRIRLFEDEIMRMFTHGLVRGSTHLCQGQEAVTVGVSAALRPGDTMTCTYRGHGAVLAMGAPMDRCFGELLGKEQGLCHGRGGSMHFTDASVGALGANAIVGANLPIAVGAALSSQYLGTGAVTVAYCGDGATNIGAFHEALNFASIWKLPVIFVVENNQYGEYSPMAATTPIARLADRAAAYGMPGEFVDGNDVLTVRSAAARAADRARSGAGPNLIEADTYRHHGHSRSDPAKYRPEGELEYWLARDPISRLQDAMTGSGRFTAERVEQLRRAAADDVIAAKERAIGWADPDPADLSRDVFA